MPVSLSALKSCAPHRDTEIVASTVTVVTASNQMWTVGMTIGSDRRDIQRVNAVPLASERSSNLAVTLALRNRHPPSVAERSCGFRWVPV